MLDKYIFNEDIKRVFNIITNGEILSRYILKDYISDIEIINEFQKKEKMENNNNPNNISRNTGNFIDSSQNLIALNNILSKTNTSIYPITAFNNSFLYLNSSFRSLCMDKLEGLIIECKWKKKYMLLLKIIKLDSFSPPLIVLQTSDDINFNEEIKFLNRKFSLNSSNIFSFSSFLILFNFIFFITMFLIV